MAAGCHLCFNSETEKKKKRKIYKLQNNKRENLEEISEKPSGNLKKYFINLILTTHFYKFHANSALLQRNVQRVTRSYRACTPYRCAMHRIEKRKKPSVSCGSLLIEQAHKKCCIPERSRDTTGFVTSVFPDDFLKNLYKRCRRNLYRLKKFRTFYPTT